jgi:hypothetical protein
VTAKAMLAEAASQIGTVERAGGWTPYGDWYASRHHDKAFATANWCDMGLSWCAWKVGEGAAFGEFAFTPWHASWFAGRGQWHTSGPRPCDAVFFSWSGSKRISDIDHIGVVEKDLGGGYIQTIEFNTANGVHRRTRWVGYVVGYGRPAYATTPAPVAADEDCWMG